MNTTQLLNSTTFLLPNNHPQQHILQLLPLDPNCQSLLLTYSVKQNATSYCFEQTVTEEDFTIDNKLNQNKQNNKKASILFLKLAIEREFGIRKGEMIMEGTNLVWDKVIMGRQRVQKSLQKMKIQNNDKCTGIILKLSFPDEMLIVLPKIIGRGYEGEVKKEVKKEGEEKAKLIFFQK